MMPAIQRTPSGVDDDFIDLVPVRCGRRLVSARPVRRVCRVRLAAHTDRQATWLGVGAKLVVSRRAPRRHWDRRRAGLAGGHLSVDDPRDGAAQGGWRHNVHRHVRIALAPVHTVLSGATLGICSLLYRFRGVGRGELVLGQACEEEMKRAG